jgi:hypothetical protein
MENATNIDSRALSIRDPCDFMVSLNGKRSSGRNMRRSANSPMARDRHHLGGPNRARRDVAKAERIRPDGATHHLQ